MNELYHHGIKGMRWGIRRYQNADGSLTPAGRKRVARLEEKYEKTTGKKLGSTTDSKGKSSSGQNEKEDLDRLAKETNDLRIKSANISAQADLLQANQRLSQLQPKKVSFGKKFVNSMMSDVITPAAKNAGKAYAEKFLKDKLGLNSKSELDILKKEVEVLDLKKRKKDNLDYLNKKETVTDRLKKENEAWRAKEENDNFKKKYSEEGRRDQALKEAADRVKNANIYFTNMNKANEQYSKFAKNFTKQQSGTVPNTSPYDPQVRDNVSIGESYVEQLLLEDKRRN